MLKLKCLHFTSKNTHVNQKDIKNNYTYKTIQIPNPFFYVFLSDYKYSDQLSVS